MPIDYAQPEPRPSTLLERLIGAGISEDRARQRIVEGYVGVAGHGGAVTDPEASVPFPTAWVFLPSN